jgi:hypothetical protein
MKQRGAISLHLVLTIFLGFGMVLFGVLAIMAFRDNETTQANLKTTVASAEKQSANKQKQQDDEANRVANQQPFRLYLADAVDGGFKFDIPKNWSISEVHNSGGTSQVVVRANPDKVVTDASGNGTQAFKVELVRRNQMDIHQSFSAKLKKKQLTSKEVKVSGLPGIWYEGAIDDQKHDGVQIVMPVRDKTLLITTEDRKYLADFNKIIATAVINP